ncbi:MAG: serine hydrolase [Bacilli bacterium]|nr:serine hydrolase [Bacilli bacterium]
MENYNKRFKEICTEARLVGASVVVVKDDKIINQDGYGYQSIEDNKMADENTIYRIASISKTVGAIALMQLVEKRKINLDSDISEYFGFLIRNPKFPDDKITVKMLTLQTSSITDGYDDENPAYDDIRRGYNGVNGTDLDVELKELLVPNDGKFYTPLTFSDNRPGTRFIYSNFGCGLMACLIEIASGEYYTDYMERHIFKPLSLDASFKASNIVHKELIADLYYPKNDKDFGYTVARTAKRFVDGGYPLFPLGQNFRGPAGGLFISMKDLSTIMRMFLNRGVVNGVRLLNEDTVDLMVQQHWFGNGENGGYRAKGIQMKVLNSFPNKPLRGHTGGAYGVRSYMFFNVKNQIGACFITNGGYYEKKTHPNIIDIFYDTLESMIENYWPRVEKESKFCLEVGKKVAFVDERKIVFDIVPYFDKEEIYLPAISLADGLNIVAEYNEYDNTLVYEKNGKTIKYTDLSNKNDIMMVPLFKTLRALQLSFNTNENSITIVY